MLKPAANQRIYSSPVRVLSSLGVDLSDKDPYVHKGVSYTIQRINRASIPHQAYHCSFPYVLFLVCLLFLRSESLSDSRRTRQLHQPRSCTAVNVLLEHATSDSEELHVELDPTIGDHGQKEGQSFTHLGSRNENFRKFPGRFSCFREGFPGIPGKSYLCSRKM